MSNNETVNQAVDNAKHIFTKILPIFKDPTGETKEIAESSNNTFLGIEMVVINVIVTVILTIIGLISVRIKLGDMAEYIKIPYVKIVVSVLITVAAVYFIMAGLLTFATNTLFKGDTNFSEMISVVGVKALIDTIITVVAVILGIINLKLGIIIFLIGSLYTTMLMIFGYSEVVEDIDGNCKAYSILIQYAGVIIFYYIMYKLALDSAMGAFRNLM